MECTRLFNWTRKFTFFFNILLKNIHKKSTCHIVIELYLKVWRILMRLFNKCTVVFPFLGARRLPVLCLESYLSWASLLESPYVSACAWKTTAGPGWASSAAPASMPSPPILVRKIAHFFSGKSHALLLGERKH